jgi:hypothetical protein
LTQAPFDPSFYQIDSDDTFNDILPQFPETLQIATQSTFVTIDEESDWTQLSEIKSVDSNYSQSSQVNDFLSLSPPVASPSEFVGEVDEEFFDNEVKIKENFNLIQKLKKNILFSTKKHGENRNGSQSRFFHQREVARGSHRLTIVNKQKPTTLVAASTAIKNLMKLKTPTLRD